MEVDTLNTVLGGVRPVSSAKPADSRLYEAAQQFEGLFISYLLREMLKSTPGGLYGDNLQGEIYQGLFVQELGKQLGAASQLGLADIVYRQMQGQAGARSQARLTEVDSLDAGVKD